MCTNVFVLDQDVVGGTVVGTREGTVVGTVEGTVVNTIVSLVARGGERSRYLNYRARI